MRQQQASQRTDREQASVRDTSRPNPALSTSARLLTL
jgi:hypothetical protein